MNFSNQLFYQWLTCPQKEETLNKYAFDYIDVRDLADAFVTAICNEAGNGRFIIDAGSVTLQNLYDQVHEMGPDMPQVPVGKPGKSNIVFPGPFACSERAKRMLNLKEFRGLGVISRDFFESLRHKGLLEDGELHNL